MRTTPSLFEMGFAAIYLTKLSAKVYTAEAMLAHSAELAKLGNDTHMAGLVAEAQQNVEISAELCFLTMAQFWGLDVDTDVQANVA